MAQNSKEIYQHRINKVIDYVNNNLQKPITLDELANQAHFSPFHFHRIFVAVIGESVNFFTNRLRLEKSARLLKFSKQRISDIGLDCGFSSSSTFSRAFKNYFGTSPTSYRKSGIIENSKICKELFPINDYLVPMSLAEMQQNFPVEIRTFEQQSVAYIRVLDSYREGVTLQAFRELVAWAKEMNLLDTQKIFGMSVDDPLVTPKEKYRYEACITLPKDFVMKSSHILETMTLPKCQYAVASVSGEFNRVATATSYLFNHWLINSEFEPAHHPGMEIFLDNDTVCDWSTFNLDLCIPVKKLKSYQNEN